MSKKETHKCGDCGETVPLQRRTVALGLGRDWAAEVPALVYKCSCGEGVIYEAMGEMLRAIAVAVINKPSRLAPQEIEFLREHLGFSAKRFAELLGVTPTHLSRWENGSVAPSAQADRLMRLLEVVHDEVAYDVAQLQVIGDKAGAPMRLRVTKRGSEWKAAA